VLAEGQPALMAPEPAALGGQSCLDGQSLDVVFRCCTDLGEDGTSRDSSSWRGLAYVGSGVLGSAAGMDKDVMKRLFAQARLPIVKHDTVLRAEWERAPTQAVATGRSSPRGTRSL